MKSAARLRWCCRSHFDVIILFHKGTTQSVAVCSMFLLLFGMCCSELELQKPRQLAFKRQCPESAMRVLLGVVVATSVLAETQLSTVPLLGGRLGQRVNSLKLFLICSNRIIMSMVICLTSTAWFKVLLQYFYVIMSATWQK